MSIKVIRQMVIDAINTIPEFKLSFVDVVPPPTAIKKFPAIALDFVSSDFTRYRGDCQFKVDTVIDIFLYNRLLRNGTTNIDSLDLVDTLNKTLQTDSALQENTRDIYIKSIMSDGGITAPVQVYRVTVHLEHIIVTTS